MRDPPRGGECRAPEDPDQRFTPGEYLLSHHRPARYSHTLLVRIRGRRVHLCARCTGQAIGALAFVLAVVALPQFRSPLFLPQFQILFGIAPLAATLDWTSQALGRRESRNGLRIVTGALLGVAWTDTLTLLLTQHWLYFLAAVGFFFVYAIVIFLVLQRSRALERVVAEHFPA